MGLFKGREKRAEEARKSADVVADVFAAREEEEESSLSEEQIADILRISNSGLNIGGTVPNTNNKAGAAEKAEACPVLGTCPFNESERIASLTGNTKVAAELDKTKAKEKAKKGKKSGKAVDEETGNCASSDFNIMGQFNSKMK